MAVARSILLFVLAALAEIGGACLVWQGVREHRGLQWLGAGVLALGVYEFVVTLQPDVHFGRLLDAYGGVFVAASLLWGCAARRIPPGPLRHHRLRHVPARRRRDHVCPAPNLSRPQAAAIRLIALGGTSGYRLPHRTCVPPRRPRPPLPGTRSAVGVSWL